MVNTVKKLPSMAVPLVTDNNTIHPVWYEFFRSFIESTDNSIGNIDTGETTLAGDGLTKSGTTLNVGAGNGIKVNPNDVAVDIIGQINTQAALEDEILVSDASSFSATRKTSIRDVVALANTFPGGITSNIQYNNNDTFGGDANFTTDGSGSVSITGDLTIDNININGNTITTDSSSNPFVFEVPAGGLNQYTFTQSGVGSSAFKAEFKGIRGGGTSVVIRSDSENSTNLSDAFLSFATNTANPIWSMGLFDSQDDDFVMTNASGLNVNQIYTIDRGTNSFTHHTEVFMDDHLERNFESGITASTTQSQGQQPLTKDINVVSTVNNPNDVVTLPEAVAGRYCLVIDNGSNNLQIYPASGDDLGAGVNSSTTLTAAGSALFIAYDSINWKQII